ncbi:acyl-CoA dehydrogenase family protein [Burkholderia pseudomallei]|uniref:acyl-CoA dehydrogenase family protein n=1 Tax=Burkholderia pseudomallei TaxID=28450 RepID=UPI00068AA776|nr:acyl-CoA dehydrogenase family protein [Burkholderia pseudomallei]
MWPDQEFEKKVDLHRAFVEKFVAPSVDEIEETKMVPCELVDALGSHGYLGGLVPASVGGLGFGRLDFGFAIASLSAESSSIRNLLTVHNMVAASIHRWGSDAVKDRWLKAVATGKAIGALALTEFGSGSDFDMIETTVSRRSGGLEVSGTKNWISCGPIASVFLVFAKFEGKHVALLVPREADNLTIEPVTRPLVGARASMLGTLHFDGVKIKETDLIGGVGFGKIAVGAYALDIGRYIIAWGALSLARTCMERCLERAGNTTRFGSSLVRHQLVAKMIAEMYLAVSAAEAACIRAGMLHDEGDPTAMGATYVAKYVATKALSSVSAAAIRLSGASGCMDDDLIARAYRDAPILEIIEGSSELHEIQIAADVCRSFDSVR